MASARPGSDAPCTWSGVKLAIAGSAIGCFARGAGAIIGQLLYGVSGADPATFASVAMLALATRHLLVIFLLAATQQIRIARYVRNRVSVSRKIEFRGLHVPVADRYFAAAALAQLTASSCRLIVTSLPTSKPPPVVHYHS